ncbi:uncharacterized protein [Pleurodeles waltl]|uniref:uncharacterized protein isoform X3 n=1 Tax=Pleurodeles waltl TaxID=8319 RepID=UPI00370998A1
MDDGESGAPLRHLTVEKKRNNINKGLPLHLIGSCPASDEPNSTSSPPLSSLLPVRHGDFKTGAARFNLKSGCKKKVAGKTWSCARRTLDVGRLDEEEVLC